MFFIDLDFFIYTCSGMMIGMENHLLDPLYTIPTTVWEYLTISDYFCTKYEWLSFLSSKGKNWTFFSKIENRPLYGSDWSSIIGDEKPSPKAYFQQLIMIPCCLISRDEKNIINRKMKKFVFDPRTVYKDKHYHPFPHSTDVFHIKLYLKIS